MYACVGSDDMELTQRGLRRAPSLPLYLRRRSYGAQECISSRCACRELPYLRPVPLRPCDDPRLEIGVSLFVPKAPVFSPFALDRSNGRRDISIRLSAHLESRIPRGVLYQESSPLIPSMFVACSCTAFLNI